MEIRVAIVDGAKSFEIVSTVPSDSSERLRWEILQAIRRGGEELATRIIQSMAFEGKRVPWEDIQAGRRVSGTDDRKTAGS